MCSQRRRRGSRRSFAGPSAHRPPSLRSRFARLGVQARRIGNSRPLSRWHRCRRAALRLEGEAGREAQIFVVVRRPGGGECVAAHDPRDRFGVLVIVRVPSVRHAAEGRHVDWIPVGTTSSVSAAVLAVRLLTSRVRSSWQSGQSNRSPSETLTGETNSQASVHRTGGRATTNTANGPAG